MSTLFEQLRAAGSRAQRKALLERALPDDLPEARKAAWAYRHVLRRRHEAERGMTSFQAAYAAAVRDHALFALDPAALPVAVELPGKLDHVLIVGWHFPEHVCLLDAALHFGVLVLSAGPAPWLAKLAAAGLVLNFRDRRCPVRLARWMAAGRPVYAMADHCYPETVSTIVPFLSYPARTPVGVFRLAERYGYAVEVLAPRDGGRRATLRRIGRTPDTGADDLCRDATAAIEAEILRSPDRWLMWPAVDKRWIGATYD